MDAESIEDLVKGLENFGGIFDSSQLQNVKILDSPVSLIVNTGGHWIAIYIDGKTVEIMDSLGLISCQNIDKHLCRFICAHIRGKTFLASPKLQSNSSSDCGKFAISFIYYRSLTSQSLKNFLTIFSENFQTNSKVIEEIFQTIQKIMTNFSLKM